MGEIQQHCTTANPGHDSYRRTRLATVAHVLLELVVFASQAARSQNRTRTAAPGHTARIIDADPGHCEGTPVVPLKLVFSGVRGWCCSWLWCSIPHWKVSHGGATGKWSQHLVQSRHWPLISASSHRSALDVSDAHLQTNTKPQQEFAR